MVFLGEIESSTNFYFRIVVLIVYLCALNLDIRENNIPCTPSPNKYGDEKLQDESKFFFRALMTWWRSWKVFGQSESFVLAKKC